MNYNIKLIANGLMASIESDMKISCEIVNTDEFNLSLGLVKFHRTNSIRSGFKQDSRSVKNLKRNNK